MKKLLAIVVLLVATTGIAEGQGCSVSLGNDTTICAGGGLQLSIAGQFNYFEDSLRIEYDATQGQSGLSGSPKVYMHSGAEITPFGGWEYPVGNWGMDDGVGQMTSLGSNRWGITIHPQSYYGYPVGSPLNGIFMVFRNADGSQTGKDAAGNDIFLYTVPSPPTSSFGGITATWKTDAIASILWSDGSTGLTTNVTASGTYWVQVTDTAGCIATDSIVVNISTAASVNLGPNQVLCSGNSITLDAGAGFANYSWSNGASSQTINVTSGGNYYVQVTDPGGCTGYDLVYIEEKDVPVAGFTWLANGPTVTFTNSSTFTPTQSQWDFQNDNTVDDTATNPVFTFPAPGTYSVTLMVENECGADTITIPVAVTATSIEQGLAASFTVSPNPFREQLQLSGLQAGGGLTYSIYNLNGSQVASGTFARLSNDKVTIETGNLVSGSYILVADQDGQFVRSLIVKP